MTCLMSLIPLCLPDYSQPLHVDVSVPAVTRTQPHHYAERGRIMSSATLAIFKYSVLLRAGVHFGGTLRVQLGNSPC